MVLMTWKDMEHNRNFKPSELRGSRYYCQECGYVSIGHFHERSVNFGIICPECGEYSDQYEETIYADRWYGTDYVTEEYIKER